MSAMSSKLSAAGHTAASLWVLRENTPARAFCERLGGIIVGEKIDEMPDAALVEDAYGWLDLSLLENLRGASKAQRTRRDLHPFCHEPT